MPGVRRLTILLVAIALAACGGDDGGGSDASADRWCTYAAQMRDRGDEFETVDFLDAAALRTTLGELRDVVDRAAEVAPAEIRADVELTKDGFDRFYDALEAVDFDVFAAEDDIFEGFGEGLDAAGERITDYNARVCGFDDGDEDTAGSMGAEDLPGAVAPDLGGLVDDEALSELSRSESFMQLFVEQIAAELEAEGFTAVEARCVAEGYDIEAMLSGEIRADDPSAVLAIFEECGISAQRLVEIGG